MPRTGWLAAGAALAALTVGLEDRRLLAAVVVAAAFFLLGGLWLPRGRRVGLMALAVGMLSIAIRAGLGPAGVAPTGAPAGSGPWTMVVETVGSPRDGHQVATILTVTGGSAGFRLAATLPRYPPIEPGDRLEVEGRARPRPDSPYGRYLERLDAWGTLDARSMAVLARPVDPGTLLEGWRRDAGENLTHVLPEPEAGLAAGILIGLRDRVDREVAAAFTTAGVSHVVAISGWNIAIVAAAVGALAGRLGRRRRAIVTAVAVAAYVVFAGASPSVLRAGAMAGVVLLARESGRSGRAAAALGLAAFLLLLAEPALVRDAGFQLSTLATAGLVAWATPLTDRLDRLTRGCLPRWLSESLGVSLAAQAATLPIVLASFGRLALISPAVNLVVVPLVTPAMAAGLLALFGGTLVSAGAPTILGVVLAAPGWVALRIIIGIVEVAAAVPFGSVAFEPVVGVALGVGSAGLGVVVVALQGRPRRRRRAETRSMGAGGVSSARRRPDGRRPSVAARIATMSLVVAVAVAGAVVVSRPAGVARITILDVGQGDAILIEGSRGGRILVDGGPDPDRLLVELDRRIPPWDRRLDAVVLSHPHEDHVAGLALLLERYRVDRVLEPGMRGPGPGYAAWLERLAQPGAPPRLSIGAGDRLTVDEVAMRVLWPIRGRVPDEPPDAGSGINNVSVVLLGVIGERRFLLTGDVEEDVDPSLLSGGLPRVDLLKVAHHGSRTATTDAFLGAVRPRIAVASAGADNPYGHPARPTLERLAASGARVYRTDVDGSVSVTFETEGPMVRTDPRRKVAATTPIVAVGQRQATTAAADAGPQRSFFCAIPEVRRPAGPRVVSVAGRAPGGGTTGRATSPSAQGATPEPPPPARTGPSTSTWSPRTGSVTVRPPRHIAPDRSGTARAPWPTRPSGLSPEAGTSFAPWSLQGGDRSQDGRRWSRWQLGNGPETLPARGGRAARLGYHRVDERPRARGCRDPALVPGSASPVRRTRARRGRGRGSPRPRRGVRRDFDRSAIGPTGSSTDERARISRECRSHRLNPGQPTSTASRVRNPRWSIQWLRRQALHAANRVPHSGRYRVPLTSQTANSSVAVVPARDPGGEHRYRVSEYVRFRN
jgi:competence protein ComEC